MQISLVVAVSQNGVIGNNNALLWHLPEDLKHFKALTMGKPIVMGRKTFESIGRPLPGRENIVLSRDLDWRAEGCTVMHSLEAALDYCLARASLDVMVIGGGQLYRLALPFADCVYMTRVMLKIEGDTTFPELNEAEWTVVEERAFPSDAKHANAYTFLTMLRDKKTRDRSYS